MIRTIRLLIPFLALGLLAACAEITRWEPVHDAYPLGPSVKMAVESQTLNPIPPEPYPVTGIDGVRAQKEMEAYRHEGKPGESKSTTNTKQSFSFTFGPGGMK